MENNTARIMKKTDRPEVVFPHEEPSREVYFLRELTPAEKHRDDLQRKLAGIALQLQQLENSTSDHIAQQEDQNMLPELCAIEELRKTTNRLSWNIKEGTLR